MAKKRVKRYVRGSESGTPTDKQLRDMTKAYVPKPANIFESMVQKLMGVGTKKRGGSGPFGMGTKPKERLRAAQQHAGRVSAAKSYGKELDVYTEKTYGSETTEPGYKIEKRKKRTKRTKKRRAAVKSATRKGRKGKVLTPKEERTLIQDINRRAGSSGVKVW
jgi:hypothetical protein